MEVFITSKNTGPSYGHDPITMKYIGTSLDEAIAAVENFVRYETPLEDLTTEKTHPEIYCVLPHHVEREYVKYYNADGWWYTIAKINVGTIG